MMTSGARTFGPLPPRAPAGLRAAQDWSSLIPVVLVLAILAAGCAGTGRSNGVRLLEAGQYPAAVEALRAEVAARPDDPYLQRDLGVALLGSDRAAEALDILRKAKVALPRDAGVVFQLGRACEATGDFDGAFAAYRDYLALGGRGKSEIAARLQAVTQRRIEAEMRGALAREDSLAVVEIPENSVAVPDYANPARSDSLAPLARGLSAMLISDLEHVQSLRVLERARIQILMDELKLTSRDTGAGGPSTALPPITSPDGVRARLQGLVRPSTGRPYLETAGVPAEKQDAALRDAVRAFQTDHGLWVDGIAGRVTSTALETVWQNGPGKQAAGSLPAPVIVAPATAPRLGRLLGARRFVQGSFIPLPSDQVQLDANIVEAKGGVSRTAGEPVSGALPNVLSLQKDLLHRILQALGIELTPAESKEVDKLPTHDFLAFLAYSRGLALEDQGRQAEALAAYREAARRDPSFQAAVTAVRIGEVTQAAQDRLNERELSNLAEPTELAPDPVLETGAATGLGPGPDTDRTADTDPSLTDPQVISGNSATIIIEGTVPGRPQ